MSNHAELRPEPSVTLLLERLAETVRHRLAPMAGSHLLRDQLASLASILGILASEGPAIDRQVSDDFSDLLAILGDVEPSPDADSFAREARFLVAGVAQDDPRQVLGAVSEYRGVADDDPQQVLGAVSEYRSRDRLRPWAALFAPTPDHGHVPQRRSVVAEDPSDVYVERQLQEWQRESGFSVVVETEMSDGYSALTRLASLTSAAGARAVVIRVQSHRRPIDAILTPIRKQAQFIQCAANAGVPVAEVVRVVDEANAPAAVLVTARVEGYVPVPWTERGRAFVERLRETRAEGFLAVLSDVHRAPIPVQDSADSPDGCVPLIEHLHGRLARWEQIYRSSMLRPDLIIEEVLLFLKTEAQVWGEEVVIHGDFRPGNVVFDPEDMVVRAVLDWDSADRGDFHEDLGYALSWPYRGSKGHALGLFADDELVEAYMRLSGRVVVSAALRYYEMLATFHRYLGFLLLARHWVDHGGDIRSGRAWLALKDDRQHLCRILDS